MKGLKDEGGEVDPESGNDIAIGSLKYVMIYLPC